MNFLQVFLKGIALLPSIVTGVEAIYGAKAGASKKDAVLSVATAAIRVTNAVEQKMVVDASAFTKGLGQVIDGLVVCLNASVWHKA